MRGDERDYESPMGEFGRIRAEAIASEAMDVMLPAPTLAPPPSPPESDVLTVDPPGPLGCYLVDANWITRGKADGIATLGTFHGEQAAVDAVLGQVVSRKGEKECKRMARAGHLLIRVKAVAPELLAAMVSEVKTGGTAVRSDDPDLLPAPTE